MQVQEIKTLPVLFSKHQKELEGAKRALFQIHLAIGAALILSFIWMVRLESVFPPLLLSLMWAPYLITQRAKVTAFIAEREQIVSFALCERDLFVCSAHPYDTEVKSRVMYALGMLLKAGNSHNIRVYSAIYGDVVWFCHWYEGDKLKSKTYPVDRNTFNEPFPDFLNRWELFKSEREYDRISWVRSKDNEWADRNLFYQTAK